MRRRSQRAGPHHAGEAPGEPPGGRRGADAGGRTRLAAALAGLVACTACTPPPAAEHHPEVVVIANAESAVSLAIARAYLEARNVPDENLLRLHLPLHDPTLVTPRDEVVSREVFERVVRDPVRAFLRNHDPEGRVSVLVTTRGVPLRIAGAPGERDQPWETRTGAAVDAELALLDRDRPRGADGRPAPGRLANPYHASEESFARWREAHPDAPLRYLVGRLTGYAVAPDPETGVPRDIARLVENAQREGPEGRYVVDEDPDQPKPRDVGNAFLLAPVADLARAAGVPLVHDTSPDTLREIDAIAGYASWGSNDRRTPPPPYYGAVPGGVRPGRFTARAIVVDLVSFNARSFGYPPRYGQSLVADLVAEGVAGAAGHVDEPMLAGVVRPHLLFAAWLTGVPVAEAYFRSLPYLGWTNLWVGDPLMRIGTPHRAPRDGDGDGVPDERDVCRVLADPDQRDSDGDGFGNRCDPDLDGDGRVGEADLRRVERASAAGLYVPACDFDGDHEVDARDAAIARLFAGLPPGPRGWAAGGTSPPPSR